MFENLYTTKMSAEKKAVMFRFFKIRTRCMHFSKLAAAAVTTALAMLLLFATVCIAALSAPAKNSIAVIYNGAEQSLKNKPFTDNSEVYVPLRELMNICGVANEDILYNQGNIEIKFRNSQVSDLKALIKINQNGISFNKDSELNIMGIKSVRSTSHPAIMVNGTTYIPSGMVIKIKNYYIAKDFDDRVYLNLLGNLEIRKYDLNGKYDAVISAPINTNGENKFSPKSYYTEDENVVIGTVADFDAKSFGHTEINGYYYPTDAQKHILLDENGRVAAVIPCEDFRHESIDPAPGGTSRWETALMYREDSLMAKRGGITVFENEKRLSSEGKEYNYCLSYCFLDFRYLVQ